MFLRKNEKTMLDAAYEHAILALATHEVGSEEYVRTLDIVTRLHALNDEPSSRLSKDTMATVGANLLSIFMIIRHESVNVITSKALSFVIRPKI